MMNRTALALMAICALALLSCGQTDDANSPDENGGNAEPKAIYSKESEIRDFYEYLEGLPGQDEWHIEVVKHHFSVSSVAGVLMDWTGNHVHLVDVFGKQGSAESARFLGIEQETENVVRLMYVAGTAGTACEGIAAYDFVRFDVEAGSFHETQSYAIIETDACGDDYNRELKVFVDSPFLPSDRDS